MALRAQIVRLLAELSSTDVATFEAALPTAALVLEQSQRLGAVPSGRVGGAPRQASAMERRRIRDEYLRRLPGALLGVALTPAEHAAIVAELRRRLDGPPRLAAQAAGALGHSGRPDVAGQLASLIRREAGTTPRLAASAIRAVSRILDSVDPQAPLDDATAQAIADVRAALEMAAAQGASDDLVSVPEAAARELGWISHHFGWT